MDLHKAIGTVSHNIYCLKNRIIMEFEGLPTNLLKVILLLGNN